MAKGLSHTQYVILKVISEMPEGSSYYDVRKKLMITLYPDLYNNYGVINYGHNSDKKNVARVVVSKSLSRLVKRGYLTFNIQTVTKTVSGETFTFDQIYVRNTWL
jgi:hypothetical protein